MIWEVSITAACILLVLLTGLRWRHSIGFPRALGAAVARLLWIILPLTALFPQVSRQIISEKSATATIHLLFDDSASMQPLGMKRLSDNIDKELEAACERLGCELKTQKLSQLDSTTLSGMTPLLENLPGWLIPVGEDPWIIVSDGGDAALTTPLDPKLKNSGRAKTNQNTSKTEEVTRGLIISTFSKDQAPNLWLEEQQSVPLAFENQPITLKVTVHRRSEQHDAEHVQIQAIVGGKILATQHALFPENQDAMTAHLTLPPLQRGQHLVQTKVLYVAGEVETWDNQLETVVEVLPNTVGALHLLGSPSWDGRFLRRYLKAEPKFDLISFFILRDPWDSQQVNERELSLIPFPVERLFRDELGSFRVLILQNFALFQFLQPEFQRNLVKFVEDGGGLLFIGGPRALSQVDLRGSPLQKILPFDAEGLATTSAALDPSLGISTEDSLSQGSFDTSKKFQLEFASPDAPSRALASVYDDWLRLAEGLRNISTLSGLHPIPPAALKKEGVTPLLQAKFKDGSTMPLVLASYPGKGRALWILSDSLWKMNFANNWLISRQLYHDFMSASFAWLARSDLRQPLVWRSFQVIPQAKNIFFWQAVLSGPAASLINMGDDWHLSVCNVVTKKEDINLDRRGELVILQGRLSATQSPTSDTCDINLKGTHPSLGSVQLSRSATLTELLPDARNPGSLHKLQTLAQHTGASLLTAADLPSGKLTQWVERQFANPTTISPGKEQVSNDYYWILESPWAFLLLLFLPVEILIRRWHLL